MDFQVEISDNHQINTPVGWTANFKICQHIVDNGKEAILGYNFYQHKLQALNLETGDTAWQIALKKEGPGMIPQVVSFYYQSADSIFILSFFQLSIINKKGELLQKYVINQKGSKINGNDTEDKFTIYSDINHSSPIYYDDDEEALYFAFKPLPPFSEKRFEQPLCGRLHLNTLQLEAIPIYLPESFTQQYYGAYERPTFLFSDDEIIYGFYLNGNLYRYRKSNGEKSSATIKVKSINRTAPPLAKSVSEADPEYLEHLNTFPTFFRITSDGKYYYRPFVGTFNKELRKRKKYILIYDNDLNPVTETQIPNDVAVVSSNISTKSGSVFFRLNNEKESLANFIFVSLR